MESFDEIYAYHLDHEKEIRNRRYKKITVEELKQRIINKRLLATKSFVDDHNTIIQQDESFTGSISSSVHLISGESAIDSNSKKVKSMKRKRDSGDDNSSVAIDVKDKIKFHRRLGTEVDEQSTKLDDADGDVEVDFVSEPTAESSSVYDYLSTCSDPMDKVYFHQLPRFFEGAKCESNFKTFYTMILRN